MGQKLYKVNVTKKLSRKLCQTNSGYGYLTYKPRKGDVCTQNTFYRSCDFENGPREPHCSNILYIAETTENRSVGVVLTFRSTVENHCPSARIQQTLTFRVAKLRQMSNFSLA